MFGIKAFFSIAYYDSAEIAQKKAKERLERILTKIDKIKYGNENLFFGFKLDENYNLIPESK
jgi:hypothetical protein